MSASWSTPGPPRDNGRSPFERLAPAAAALSVSCSSKHSCSARQPRPRASARQIRHHTGFRHLCRRGNDALPYFLNLDMPLAAYVYVAMLTVFTAVVAGVLSCAARDRTTSARHLEAGERHRRAAPGTRLDGHDHCAGGDRGDGTPGNHQDQLGWNPTRPDQGQLQRGVLPRGHISADPDAPAGMPRPSMSANRFAVEKTKTDLVTRLEAEPAVDDVTVAATIPGAEPRARIAIDGAVNSIRCYRCVLQPRRHGFLRRVRRASHCRPGVTRQRWHGLDAGHRRQSRVRESALAAPMPSGAGCTTSRRAARSGGWHHHAI